MEEAPKDKTAEEDEGGLDHIFDGVLDRSSTSLSEESRHKLQQQEIIKRNARKKKRSLSELDGDPDNF